MCKLKNNLRSLFEIKNKKQSNVVERNHQEISKRYVKDDK